MDGRDIPQNVLVNIAMESPQAYKAMLSIPEFGRMTIGSLRRYIIESLTVETVKKGIIKRTLGGKLHCEYGPAIEIVNGKHKFLNDEKVYAHNGVIYRIERPGNLDLWINNKKELHRIGGPAATIICTEFNFNIAIDVIKTLHLSHGHKINKFLQPGISIHIYAINGIAGRKHNPAIEISNGVKFWLKNKNLHNKHGPAMILPDGSTKWYRNGRSHRDDDPSAIKKNKTKYYIDGKKHRSGGLPAIVRADGGKEYWIHGKRHNINGPAVIKINKCEEYWENGVLHRDGDLPAVINANGTRKYLVRGANHRSGGLPAIISKGREEYWENGGLHRIGGPAIYNLYPDYTGCLEFPQSNVAVVELWAVNGKIERKGAPAITYSDGTMAWYKNGSLHRYKGPAIIRPTGTIKYYIHGRLHSFNGKPAIIKANGTKKWYKRGERHRKDDLPAIIKPDGTAKWYIRDQRIKVNKSTYGKIPTDYWNAQGFGGVLQYCVNTASFFDDLCH